MPVLGCALSMAETSLSVVAGHQAGDAAGDIPFGLGDEADGRAVRQSPGR